MRMIYKPGTLLKMIPGTIISNEVLICKPSLGKNPTIAEKYKVSSPPIMYLRTITIDPNFADDENPFHRHFFLHKGAVWFINLNFIHPLRGVFYPPLERNVYSI